MRTNEQIKIIETFERKIRNLLYILKRSRSLVTSICSLEEDALETMAHDHSPSLKFEQKVKFLIR